MFVYKVYGNLHVKLLHKKNLFYLLLEIDFSHISDFWWFYCPLRFSLNSDCLSVPGNWLTVRSWILMKFFSFVENWSLVIWRLRWICLKNVAIYWSCRWRLGMLDLSPNWFEIVFQAFDFWLWLNEFVNFIILWRDHICW